MSISTGAAAVLHFVRVFIVEMTSSRAHVRASLAGVARNAHGSPLRARARRMSARAPRGAPARAELAFCRAPVVHHESFILSTFSHFHLNMSIK